MKRISPEIIAELIREQQRKGKIITLTVMAEATAQAQLEACEKEHYEIMGEWIEKIERNMRDLPIESRMEGTNIIIPEKPAKYIRSEKWQDLIIEIFRR